MRVDGLLAADLRMAGDAAEDMERLGYAGVWTAEMDRDPFLPLVPAAQRTGRVEIGTSIAVAFARSPMTLAHTAWDLQEASGGRFVLGLGSQIKAHVVRRFSMPWSRPAARMREFVLAMRAIWSSWQDRTPLDFRGEMYSHTLMTPFFDPGPNPFGAPKVFLAGVGERMTEVAGEVADGFLCHAFSTERYLREVTLPALQRGLARSGRTLDEFEVSGPAFVVTGGDEEELARSLEETRRHLAFYGSTPAYRGVLELHGWGDLGDELNRLSKRGRWDEMGRLIDDEVLHAFAVVAAPEELARRIGERYGDVVDRLTLASPLQDRERWAEVLRDLHDLPAR
jgi:probable F420-dependent oxidoreductase